MTSCCYKLPLQPHYGGKFLHISIHLYLLMHKTSQLKFCIFKQQLYLRKTLPQLKLHLTFSPMSFILVIIVFKKNYIYKIIPKWNVIYDPFPQLNSKIWKNETVAPVCHLSSIIKKNSPRSRTNPRSSLWRLEVWTKHSHSPSVCSSRGAL